MSEEIELVCCLATAPWEVPGSDYTHACSRCGRGVMIAPSGQRLLREKPHAVIICTQCYVADPGNTVDLAATPDEIREEVRKAHPNLHRKRN